MRRRIILGLLLLSLLLPSLAAASPPLPPEPEVAVPILLYHRFGPTAANAMTVRTTVFESHLQYLRENGYTVIPLRRLVDWYRGRGPAPGPKSVVIAADDGHRSVYTEMAPLVKKYQVPVTLFIYPSAISNARYAMTWEELRELQATGLFDCQSHTYWHPNFKKERRRLSPAEFDQLATTQLRKSRDKLEKQLGTEVDLLAWPFGLYDDDLLTRAAAAGYVATFTIERRHATASSDVRRLPRYIVLDADRGDAFARLLEGSGRKQAPAL